MIKLLTSAALPLSSAVWDEYANRLIPRYTLPAWIEPYQAENMSLWLDRIELEEKLFLVIGAWKRLNDIPSTIPNWPLRAVVGLALEEKATILGIRVNLKEIE